MSEAWRPALGFEGRYEVSDQGRVRSLDRHVRGDGGSLRRIRGRLLRPWKNRAGYWTVDLWSENCGRSREVHQLVLEAFVGPKPALLEGCHNDGDCTHNELTNLRWDTRSANQLDRVRDGHHWQALKTHCPQGHEYTTENTVRTTSGRRCRTCRRIASNAASRRRRAHTGGNR